MLVGRIRRVKGRTAGEGLGLRTAGLGEPSREGLGLWFAALGVGHRDSGVDRARRRLCIVRPRLLEMASAPRVCGSCPLTGAPAPAAPSRRGLLPHLGGIPRTIPMSGRRRECPGGCPQLSKRAGPRVAGAGRLPDGGGSPGGSRSFLFPLLRTEGPSPVGMTPESPPHVWSGDTDRRPRTGRVSRCRRSPYPSGACTVDLLVRE